MHVEQRAGMVHGMNIWVWLQAYRFLKGWETGMVY